MRRFFRVRTFVSLFLDRIRTVNSSSTLKFARQYFFSTRPVNIAGRIHGRLYALHVLTARQYTRVHGKAGEVERFKKWYAKIEGYGNESPQQGPAFHN